MVLDRSACLTVPNPCPAAAYTVKLVYPEFTCCCPFSDGMDAATLTLTYRPNETILELGALREWLEGFAPQSITHEAVAVEIATVLTGLLGTPVAVTMAFDATEGIGATVTVGA